MNTLVLTLVATILVLLLAIYDLMTLCIIIRKESWVEKCFKWLFRDKYPYEKDFVLGQVRLFFLFFPMAINAFSGSFFMITVPAFSYLFYAAAALTLVLIIQLWCQVFKTNKKLKNTKKELAKTREELENQKNSSKTQ